MIFLFEMAICVPSFPSFPSFYNYLIIKEIEEEKGREQAGKKGTQGKSEKCSRPIGNAKTLIINEWEQRERWEPKFIYQ
jgi:hypothetical protein